MTFLHPCPDGSSGGIVLLTAGGHLGRTAPAAGNLPCTMFTETAGHGGSSRPGAVGEGRRVRWGREEGAGGDYRCIGVA